jgi:hypothetical protein
LTGRMHLEAVKKGRKLIGYIYYISRSKTGGILDIRQL